MAGSNAYLRLVDRLGRTEALDGVVSAMEPIALPLVSTPALRGFFRGDATRVPPHGILTDLPFGAWPLALMFDLMRIPESERTARRLVGIGLLGAVPTAVTGLGEWASLDARSRRIGVVHAAATSTATAIFTASWLARVRGHHGAGVSLARLGMGALVAGGFLGGYLGGTGPAIDDGPTA